MNKHQIIADSCLDATNQMKREFNIKTVPLTITMDKTDYIDKDLDINFLLSKIKESKSIKTACPSPFDFDHYFRNKIDSFAITISSKLSGTYNSAVLGKELAHEIDKNLNIHIFDSLSASAGEILTAIKLNEFIKLNFDFNEIVEKTENFIKNMSTYFVLEDLSTLIKNGRMSAFLGYAAMALKYRPIMKGTNGNIELHEKIRGTTQALTKLASIIGVIGKKDKKDTLVITHCNNKEGAEFLKNLVEKVYKFPSTHILPTQGLSTIYANNGGIIAAF